MEQLIGTTRGRQIGDPIGQRVEQPSEYLGRNPRVTRRTVPVLSLFFGVIHQLSSLSKGWPKIGRKPLTALLVSDRLGWVCSGFELVGKPEKLAFTACARKLLTTLNAMMGTHGRCRPINRSVRAWVLRQLLSF